MGSRGLNTPTHMYGEPRVRMYCMLRAVYMHRVCVAHIYFSIHEVLDGCNGGWEDARIACLLWVHTERRVDN